LNRTRNDVKRRQQQNSRTRQPALFWPEPRVTAERFRGEDDDETWSEAVQEDRAVGYPDNPAGPDTRTRGKRIDYILHSPGLRTVQAEVLDQRDWSADGTGAAVQVGTADDLAVRPSDHNFVFAVLSVSSPAGGRPR
jgi:hypothetical protein